MHYEVTEEKKSIRKYKRYTNRINHTPVITHFKHDHLCLKQKAENFFAHRRVRRLENQWCYSVLKGKCTDYYKNTRKMCRGTSKPSVYARR